MANDEKTEVKEQSATITFDIPAYVDKKTNQPFKRIVTVSTKKAYAMFKRTMEKYTPPEK